MKIEHKVDMYRYKEELDRISARPVPENSVLFYGSSTFGIWKTLEQDFAAYNAVNVGFGGSTSDEALFHYETVAKRFRPRAVVWYYGDNEPVCGYTVEETTYLFEEVWRRLRRDFPEVKVIAVATKTSPARDMFSDFVRQVNDWQRQFVEENGDWMRYVETADICRKEGKYIEENYLGDLLHFGPKGYALLMPRIQEKLDEVL